MGKLLSSEDAIDVDERDRAAEGEGESDQEFLERWIIQNWETSQKVLANLPQDKKDMLSKALDNCSLTEKTDVECALGQIENDEDRKELADAIRSWMDA